MGYTAKPRMDPSDDTILQAIGTEIPSNVDPNVVYHVGRRVGEGGMSVAYLALRSSPQGNAPVVVKVLRPRFVLRFGEAALLSIQKEAVALGRLNERVPPTPFVLRLIDVGSVHTVPGQRPLDIPWIAVEYVHGGAEGTTLADRITHSVRQTGCGFDLGRAAHAVECLAKGLSAVHEVGVIHRDIKPENVLCCGFGDDEIFKVADFGVARPAGVAATFGGNTVGTPGYAAPELMVMDQRMIGPSSDVFGLAAVIYFMMTGDAYFPVHTVSDAILSIQSPLRRSLLDSHRLVPELRERPSACRAIDQLLARATAALPSERPRDVATFAASLLAHMRSESRRRRVAPLKREIEPASTRPSRVPAWSWLTRQMPGDDFIVRSVAWDGDGRCLAATSTGLMFWDGTRWVPVTTDGAANPQAVRFTHRVAAGKWLVGSDDGTLAIYTSAGPRETVRLSGTTLHVELFSGNLDDLGILASRDEQGSLSLHALVGRRWLKRLPLDDVAVITSAARVGDATWMIAGLNHRGGGVAALYSPLEWTFQPIQTPQVRAFLACAGHPDLSVGIVGGSDGTMLYIDETGTWVESIRDSRDLSAVVVDSWGTCWAGAAGKVWCRAAAKPGVESSWDCVWEDPAWQAPIVSMFADVDLVMGVTADGGIVEARPTELQLGTLLRAPPSIPR